MNQVCLSGRMTKDPELRTDSTGRPVVNFMLAVNRNKTKTDFIPIVCWGDLAKSVATCGFKSMSMSVSGHLRQDNFEKQGVQMQSLSVEAYSIDYHEKRQDPAQGRDISIPF